ncbi:MAG: tRNA-dihydrouridine synthase [Phycisphaerales bacterium]|nr:tRNA-dihydrouridine synthase [Phycisphaerales bacterium]
MLRIGPFEFPFPVVQAALSGYSDAPMRQIARQLGCPYAIHEVVLDKLVLQRGRLQREIFHIPADDHPVGGQLMGAEPTMFGEAAAVMAARGYDVIDINFGCPVRKVLGRCRGGFLLSEPRTAIEIVRRVRDAVPPVVPVTVKMRRGLDDSPESERKFFQIFDAALEVGVSGFTIHGRTVEQRYVGPSRWTFLEKLREYAPHVTLLGSGDLFTAEDAVRMLDQTGVNGVTVARGAIGNPWIFAEAQALLNGDPLPAPPSVAEQGLVIMRHFELCEALHGEDASRIMRKFGIKYSELHPFAADVKAAFIRAGRRVDWMAVMNEWYAPDRDWPPGVRRNGPGDLIAAGACA